MGIDYGEKRVGIAVSDPSKTFSSPLIVLENTNDLVEEIEHLCKEQEVEAIVVGESKDYKMEDNKIMEKINVFVEELNKLGIPVHMHPEFLTSREAEHIQGKTEMHDASAAALILKSYLETHINKK